MVAQEQDIGALGHCACEAGALVLFLDLATIIERGNGAMERHRVLRQARQKTVFCAGNRGGVRHMRVHHTTGIWARGMDLTMDLDRGHLTTTRAVKNIAFKVDEQNVARLHLRPVRSVAIEQEDVVVAVNRQRVVIINAFVVAMDGRDAQQSSDLYAGCGKDLLVNRRSAHVRKLPATEVSEARN